VSSPESNEASSVIPESSSVIEFWNNWWRLIWFWTWHHGDPNNLEDYKGGRDYDDLLTFAKENLGPTCGPENIDLCDADQKAKIEAIQAKGLDVLEAEIKELDDTIKNAEDNFATELKKLQETYEQLQKDKDEAVEAAKGKDLGLMKTVRAYLQAKAGNHDEL